MRVGGLQISKCQSIAGNNAPAKAQSCWAWARIWPGPGVSRMQFLLARCASLRRPVFGSWDFPRSTRPRRSVWDGSQRTLTRLSWSRDRSRPPHCFDSSSASSARPAVGLAATGDRDNWTSISWTSAAGRSATRDGRRRRGQLLLPHPEMHRRAFVLLPLREVAPVWRHPRLGLSVSRPCWLGCLRTGIARACAELLDSAAITCDKQRK